MCVTVTRSLLCRPATGVNDTFSCLTRSHLLPRGPSETGVLCAREKDRGCEDRRRRRLAGSQSWRYPHRVGPRSATRLDCQGRLQPVYAGMTVTCLCRYDRDVEGMNEQTPTLLGPGKRRSAATERGTRFAGIHGWLSAFSSPSPLGEGRHLCWPSMPWWCCTCRTT